MDEQADPTKRWPPASHAGLWLRNDSSETFTIYFEPVGFEGTLPPDTEATVTGVSDEPTATVEFLGNNRMTVWLGEGRDAAQRVVVAGEELWNVTPEEWFEQTGGTRLAMPQVIRDVPKRTRRPPTDG